jgi:hypothetical protein
MATWAKGVDFKNSANTARVGGVGIYGTDGSAQKAYLGIGTEPWNKTGLEVTSSEVSFKGNKVYHAGSKPTPAEIGAAASNHTHNYAASPSAGGSASTVYLPRTSGASVSANYLPGANKFEFKEFGNDCANIPNANWYHIFTGQGGDANYNTQLALGMTTQAVYFRNRTVGTWGGWKQLAFTDSSISGNASTATKLQSARTISLGGILSGSASFDGSGNVTINATANDITTITKSLSVTTSWADTGITGSNLGSGTYAVQMYVNDGTNTSQYQEFYSGIMSWYSGTTNSGEADEILLHKAGHANNGRHVYLRTIRTTGGGYLKLQISCTHAFTAASNIIFKFKKLI